MNVKKFASIIFIIIFTIFSFIGCKKDGSDIKTTQITTAQQKKSTTITNSMETKIETTISPKITDNDLGGGEIVQEKYRQCYYRIFYQLAQLVDSEKVKEWETEVLKENPDDTNEMIVKRFVLDFNISREDFEKANLELAKVLYDPNSPPLSMNPKDYINQEMFELYNADIIYTFDDEIINKYYLSGEYPFVYESDYEQAVASGEYISQTEEWVNVEAMEAEIIAKYGEAEIVTDTAEQTANETTAEVTTAVETTIPETESQITE